MSKYLKDLPYSLLKIIEIIKGIASHLGYPTYLVGGFVRDLILKRENLDLDITTEGDGIRLAEELVLKIEGKITRHLKFGTATVISPDGFKIDIATARKEFYPKPAVLPKVEFGSIKDDLARRDFTINALAVRIYPDDEDELIDFFSGYQDILKKKIRVLHNKSFIDDPTRILRAIRFEQRFDFHIEKDTLKLIKEAVSMKMFEKLSPHRLKDELILILKENNPIKYIVRIEELVGWKNLIPKLKLNKRKIDFLNSTKKTVDWYNQNFPHKRQLDVWLMYLICLLDGLDKEVLSCLLDRFSFSRGQIKRILSFINNKKVLKYKLKNKLKPSKVYQLLEPLSYEVILLIMAKFKNYRIKKNIEDFLKIYNNVRLNITGDDLKKLGIEAGPRYQYVLNKLLLEKLDRDIKTKKQEWEFVKRMIKQ